MPTVTLLNWNLRSAFAHEKELKMQLQSLKYVVIPDLPLTVKMDFPQPEFDAINRDPLLIQIMAETCQDAFFQTIKTKIIPRLIQLDQQCPLLDLDTYAAARESTIEGIRLDITSGSQSAKSAIEQRIQRLEIEKKQYVGYRKKVIKGTVTTITGGVAAGAGLAGAVATGGATLAISIIAAYRTVMGGLKLIVDCWQEANQVQTRVQKGLESLKATYASGKGYGVARDVGMSAFNAVIKPPVSTAGMANLSTISSDNELWRGKLTHLRFLAHEMSETLNTLLNDTEKLKQQIAGDPKHMDLTSKVAEMEKKVNTLLTEGEKFMSMKKPLRIQDAHQQAEAGLQAQEAVTGIINTLKASRSDWVDKWDTIINTLADLAITAAGYGLTTAPSSASDYVSLTFGVPTDAYGVCNSMVEVTEALGYKEKITGAVKRKMEELKKKFTSGKTATAVA